MRYDRIAQPGLLAMTGILVYALATFEPTELRPPRLGSAVRTVEVAPGDRPEKSKSVTELSFVKYMPFRTIIELPPPPPHQEVPPPALPSMASFFRLVMMDPPRGAMFEDRMTGRLTMWRVGETRTLKWKDRSLDITLERVDANDFSMHFSAPKGQTFVLRLFGTGP